jgi:hypothetical protein
MKKMHACLAALCAVMMCAGSLLADQDDSLIVLSPQEECEIQARRAAQQEALMDTIGFGSKSGNLDDYDSNYLYRIYPSANYFPVSITPSGDNIQLHDGSLWYVHPNQRNIIKNWVQTDKLFIKPNVAWFSSYSYVLQNRTIEDRNQRIVEVSLLEPPVMNGDYTRWVIDVDYHNHLVYLNDDTVWYINPNDSSFNKWQIGQRLVIGVNNRWRTSEFPHILINAGIYRAPYCEAELIK